MAQFQPPSQHGRIGLRRGCEPVRHQPRRQNLRLLPTQAIGHRLEASRREPGLFVVCDEPTLLAGGECLEPELPVGADDPRADERRGVHAPFGEHRANLEDAGFAVVEGEPGRVQRPSGFVVAVERSEDLIAVHWVVLVQEGVEQALEGGAVRDAMESQDPQPSAGQQPRCRTDRPRDSQVRWNSVDVGP